MIRAKDAYKAGDKAETMKLAELANRCAKDAKLKFSKDELSPSELLAKLTPVKLDPSEKPDDRSGVHLTRRMIEPQVSRHAVDQAVATGKPRDGIQLAGTDDEQFELPEAPVRPAKPKRTTASSRQPSSLKERAAMLVAQSRDDIESGRYDDAKRHALEADELGVSYGVFEDRPELLLADIDRRMNTTTIVEIPAPRPSIRPWLVRAPQRGRLHQPVTWNRAGCDSTESEPAQAASALKLLEQARRDLQAGNFESAQAKAEQAQQLNVVYKLFEDMPEVVLNEIEDRRIAENAVRKNRNSAEGRDNGKLSTETPPKPKARCWSPKRERLLKKAVSKKHENWR